MFRAALGATYFRRDPWEPNVIQFVDLVFGFFLIVETRRPRALLLLRVVVLLWLTARCGLIVWNNLQRLMELAPNSLSMSLATTAPQVAMAAVKLVPFFLLLVGKPGRARRRTAVIIQVVTILIGLLVMLVAMYATRHIRR